MEYVIDTNVWITAAGGELNSAISGTSFSVYRLEH